MRDEGAWLGTARTDGEKCVFSTDVCTGCWAGPRGEGPGCCDPPDCRPAEPQPSLWLGFDTVPDLVNSLFLKTLSGSFCRSHVEMAESDGDPSTALRAAARLPAPGSGQPARLSASQHAGLQPSLTPHSQPDPTLHAHTCTHMQRTNTHKRVRTCTDAQHKRACTYMRTRVHTHPCTNVHAHAHAHAPPAPLPSCCDLAEVRGAWWLPR